MACSSSLYYGKREPKDDLRTHPILKKHKANSHEKKVTKDGRILQKSSLPSTLIATDTLQLTKSAQSNLIPVKETVEGLDYFLEAISASEKTLFIANLSTGTLINQIIRIFKDVGQIVSVRITLSNRDRRLSSAFVEFASAAEAKKAQETKNGAYLRGNKITLSMLAEIGPYPPRPKYCIDCKVWYGDYLQRETRMIEEDEAADETTFFVGAVDVRKKTLFVAHLSPHTKMKHIFDFFENVGQVVSVRLVVNDEGRHVGFGFIEFASPYLANKALEEKNGEYLHDHKIFLDLARTAPCPLRPEYDLAEKLWYEDFLLREMCLIEEDEAMRRLDESPVLDEIVAVGKRTLFVSHLAPQTKISDIINFFKDVGEVVHVRLMVTYKGKHLDHGFVEFASANDAKKALEKKDGEYLHDCKVYLDMARTAPYPPRPMYCIDHKVWYEDYLRRESRLIEGDEAVEGLDETSDYVKEVAVRKKTLFFANLHVKTNTTQIIDFFKDVGEVVGVRFTVNREGQRVGCGYVEFASAKEAKKALEKKNGERLWCRYVHLDVDEIAPYPLRPKYNLAEKQWYEDYLLGESSATEEDDLETKPIPEKKLMDLYCGKKITFSEESHASSKARDKKKKKKM